MWEDVRVIDCIPGSGKTTFILDEIANRYRSNKSGVALFPSIIVTPFLSEVKRMKDYLKAKGLTAHEPTVNSTGKKLDNFKKLISEGKIIITTHSMVDCLDNEALDMLRARSYSLYLDEVHDIVEKLNISPKDYKMILEQKLITTDDNKLISWIDTEYKGKFTDIKNLADLGALYKYDDTVYVYCFPKRFFENMISVTICCYMFEGQLMSSYFKMYNIPYCRKTLVTHYDSNLERTYNELVDWVIDLQQKDIDRIRPLINLYEGNLNYTKGITLSATYLEKAGRKGLLKVVKNNTLNWFNNIIKGKSEQNLWCTLKSVKSKLSGKGYTKGFAPVSIRSTNEYINKVNVAYIYNRYLNPIEKNFFVLQGIEVNEDLFSVSELIQFIWRSQIRVGKPINLYLPSERMRNLFKDYLRKNEDF